MIFCTCGTWHAGISTPRSPCNHHTICRIDDAVDVLHTLRIFDLGNDINMLSSVCHKELTDFVNCLCIPDKGSCNKINILFNTKRRSPLSFSVRFGRLIETFGTFTPFFSPSSPPFTTVQTISGAFTFLRADRSDHHRSKSYLPL